jgi:hypothetical protein
MVSFQAFRTIKLLDFAANFSLIQAELGSRILFAIWPNQYPSPLFGDGRLWLYSVRRCLRAAVVSNTRFRGNTNGRLFRLRSHGMVASFSSDYCAVGNFADGRFRRGRFRMDGRSWCMRSIKRLPLLSSQGLVSLRRRAGSCILPRHLLSFGAGC